MTGSKGDLYCSLLVNASAPMVLPGKQLVKAINSVLATTTAGLELLELELEYL